MDYILHVVIFILIYAVVVQSLNLLLGYMGIISMCHAVFVAVGAYTAALISVHLGYHFLVGTLVGFVLAFIVGALLALPSLRIKGEYVIVFTVGFQMVAFEYMLTAREVTQGQGGIAGIPSPEILGHEIISPLGFLLLIAVMAVFCFAVTWRITRSPFGRLLKAVREDEEACRALGKNPLKQKVLVFAVGGGLAAIAGSFLAYYITYISPFDFTIDASVMMLVMVILGGAGNYWGPLVGAALLIGMPEALRFVPGAAGIIDALREVFYGALLVVFMMFRPEGILPESLEQKRASKIAAAWARMEEGSTQAAEEEPEEQPAGDPTLPALEVRGLSKSFGGLQAVDDASLVLPLGGTVGLIGPNGCGKTTIFNLVTGFLKPDGGSILVQGQDITNLAPYKMASRGLARSWQDVRIFPGMTVLDNVLVARPGQSGESLLKLFVEPRRVAREERANHQKALEYLGLVGLADKAGQLASGLSTAEQKLVALARLLATECPVLLLDEPTAALDMDSVKRIIGLIERIAVQKKKTLLLIEHNLDVVRGLVKETYFMSEGRVLAHGDPAALMKDPKLAEVYFGT